MDAVKGVLHSVGEFLSTASKTVGPYLDRAGDILDKCRVLVFLLGFFGLLFTFLWFLFRYLDKKRLTLPAVAFTLFFFVFLSGNILLISQDSGSAGSAGKTAQRTSSQTESARRIAAEEPALPQAADAAQPSGEGEPAQTEADQTADGEPAQADGAPQAAEDAPQLPEADGAPAETPG